MNKRRPTWESHFPIKQSAEHRSSRRQFLTFTSGSLLVLLASALTTRAAWFRSLFYRQGDTGKAIATVGALAIGESKSFTYPTEHDPCLLIRLSEDRYVAYSQKCTHLMCPVHYNRDRNQIVCPCHSGYFSPQDGRVLAGPPPEPLPSLPIEIRDEQIWVIPANTRKL